MRQVHDGDNGAGENVVDVVVVMLMLLRCGEVDVLFEVVVLRSPESD